MKLTTLILALAVGTAMAGEEPKNIILFIGDGMSTPQRMTAEEFSRKSLKRELALNHLPFQATTRTCSASSLVTDSAAAATAIACGGKTYNHGIGVDAKGKPQVSCAEVAKEEGKKVGIVTTVTINHATPAGFYAHRKDRGESYAIGLDLVASGFDYFAGGGLSRHNDEKNKLYKGDIYTLAKEAGYDVILKDRAAFDALKPGAGKTWYVACDEAMPYAIDADAWTNVPTLAKLTAKGIALLENDDEGFFMMVEGGRVDWAGHANDAATNLREVLALDEAVRVALDYQKKHPDTLVIVTGDHETGGMTMGFAGTGYSFSMERLAYQKCSADALWSYIRKEKPADLAALMPFLEKNFGFLNKSEKGNPMTLTKAEYDELDKAFAHDLELARKGKKDNEAYDADKITRLPTTVKSIFSHKCGIGWTSGAHTALPVLTTAGGPGAERFSGFLDNTDISKIIKDLVD